MILRVCQLTSHWRGALAGKTEGGVAGVPISGFGHYGNFQAKSATDRGEPLSAPAIVGAAAASSATTPEQRRSALLDADAPLFVLSRSRPSEVEPPQHLAAGYLLPYVVSAEAAYMMRSDRGNGEPI